MENLGLSWFNRPYCRWWHMSVNVGYYVKIHPWFQTNSSWVKWSAKFWYPPIVGSVYVLGV